MSAAKPTARAAANGRLALNLDRLHAKTVFSAVVGAAETASLNRQNERAAILFEVAAVMARAFFQDQDAPPEISVSGFFGERAAEERRIMKERGL